MEKNSGSTGRKQDDPKGNNTSKSKGLLMNMVLKGMLKEKHLHAVDIVVPFVAGLTD